MWGRWPGRLAAALWASDLVWLPSHIGIKGNELADSLANTATAKPDIDVNRGLELSEDYNMVDTLNVRHISTSALVDLLT